MNNSSKDIASISKWIIKIWGGIKGIHDNTIKTLVDDINSKGYLFNNISSWSKIHSFKDINNDVIYDSKVIYTLNWFIMQLGNNKFLHQPLSRNRKLTIFPIDAIINFYHSDLINLNLKGERVTNKIYYPKNECYIKYREIVHDLNNKIWTSETIDLTELIGKEIRLKDYPFFTELLLFNMSDNVVYKDIIEKITIKI